MNEREITKKIYQELSRQLFFNAEIKHIIRMSASESHTTNEEERINRIMDKVSEKLLHKSRVLK
tara:strand:+ start:170 stop:361 length:192 start_codon:yes stop_codon:yes gene_type:complete